MADNTPQNWADDIGRTRMEHLADVLDESEAAAYLHQKPRTLRIWRTRGLPFYKPSAKVILYKRADLDAWLDKFRIAEIRPSHVEGKAA